MPLPFRKHTYRTCFGCAMHAHSHFFPRHWILFLAAATSIVSTILPITSAEPALFGVYADDLFSRWRALRGFRKTLADDHE